MQNLDSGSQLITSQQTETHPISPKIPEKQDYCDLSEDLEDSEHELSRIQNINSIGPKQWEQSHPNY